MLRIPSSTFYQGAERLIYTMSVRTIKTPPQVANEGLVLPVCLG